jgi:UDP-N-acetylmuramate-alanine ligase
VLCQVVSREIDANQELLDVDTLSAKIGEGGTSSRALPDPKSIQEFLLSHVGTNDVIVVMSNGSFGGLPQILENALVARFGR